MTEKAVLAGGCFWGMQELIRKISGVLTTRVGYTGGTTDKPTYKDVCTGKTGHAEAIEIEFDPTQISFDKLLDYFFRMHDPSTLNQQGGDIGTQYRSAIFYSNEQQLQIAEKKIKQLEAARRFKSKIVTKLEPFKEFFEAEDYHQDYLQKKPDGYTCHYLRDWD